MPSYSPPPPPPPPARRNPSDSTAPQSVLPRSSTAPEPLSKRDEKFTEIVKRVQAGLYAYGYYTGTLDGVVGPETRAAITKFQTDHSLSVTGTVTPEVLDALGIQAS